MRYAIVATLGPASSAEGDWRALLEVGATAFRLNTSHISLTELETWLERLRLFLAGLQPLVPLVLDLQGSKWRLGDLPAAEVHAGQVVELVLGDASSQPTVLPVPHPDFFAALPASNGEIALNDARVILKVETQRTTSMWARVVRGGQLSSRRGITLTESAYRHESLGEKDKAIVTATQGFGFVDYAISYVRDAAEMAHYRAQIGKESYLIAKIERQPALEEVSQIAGIADELWLCRGDLGAELGLTAMAAAVSRFSAALPGLKVPALMAGQVLEHMTAAPIPTRSEVCYLYDTLQAGYAGVVLSDETAVGQYPVESCRAAAMFKENTS